MRRHKGVVLLSGGADSATLLYLAMTECPKNLHALSVDYGQRHKKELECAKVLCKELKIPHIIVPFDLSIFGGSPLTDPNLPVPSQVDNQQTSTVVPYRNTFLITLCAAYCKQHNLNTIYIGVSHEDLISYEDCREVFLDSLENSLRLGGTVHDLVIRAPFINSYKEDIITLGHHKLGVPYAKTWTCYEGKDYPCLECDACKERIDSFIAADIPDPILTQEDWLKLTIDLNNI